MDEDEKRIIVKIHFKPEDGAVFNHLRRTPQKHRNWEIKKVALNHFSSTYPPLSQINPDSSAPAQPHENQGRREDEESEDAGFETF